MREINKNREHNAIYIYIWRLYDMITIKIQTWIPAGLKVIKLFHRNHKVHKKERKQKKRKEKKKEKQTSISELNKVASINSHRHYYNSDLDFGVPKHDFPNGHIAKWHSLLVMDVTWGTIIISLLVNVPKT